MISKYQFTHPLSAPQPPVGGRTLAVVIILFGFSAQALPLDSCKALLARGNLSAAFAGARSLRDGRVACALYQQIVEHANVNDTLKRDALHLLVQAYNVEGDTAQYRVWQNKLSKPKAIPAHKDTCKASLAVDDPWMISAADATASIAEVKTPAQDTAPAVKGHISGYTLQIGSFATRENAAARKLQLDTFFNGVSCTEATIQGRQFFRVRIGSFASPEDAQGFARRNLSPRSIGYSIVKQ